MCGRHDALCRPAGKTLPSDTEISGSTPDEAACLFDDVIRKRERCISTGPILIGYAVMPSVSPTQKLRIVGLKDYEGTGFSARTVSRCLRQVK
ncbi:hypothetical protein EVAR_32693_1 [Eumeta japonica]|uniref:Uncharacterized protein n=1 Tax=Eumeta variegata TaxID=151549 RepID=A0A4C1VQ32_EUMVA|nr:hypothetical protein EVAR_32693_1 [Eumeta japonica]